MTTIAQHVMDFLAAQSLHLLILFAAVLAATVLLRHKTAHLRYLLWLLIVAKCLIPPLHTIPLAVLPEADAIDEGRLTMDEGEGIDDFRLTMDEGKRIDDFRWTRDEVGDVQRSGLSLPENEHAQAWAANAVGTAQPAEEHAKAPTTNAVTLIAALWLGGATVYILAISVKGVRFERYVRRQRVELTAQSHPAWAGFLAATLPNARPFRLYQLSRPGQPFVWGLWRGAIYLPSNFADVNDPEKQQSILMHEAGHILRLDPVVNLLQVVAQGLFWFHPLVWAANRIIRAEREKCCDEFAVATLKAAPRSYCTAIVDALMAAGPARPAIPTLAVAGPVKNIEDRIKTLLTPGKRFYTRPTIAAILSILLLAIVVVPTTVSLSQRGRKSEVSNNMASHVLASQAAVYMNNGEYERAGTLLKEALDLSPDFAEGWVGYGKTLIKLRDYSKGQKAYEKALELHKRRYNDVPNANELIQQIHLLVLLNKNAEAEQLIQSGNQSYRNDDTFALFSGKDLHQLSKEWQEFRLPADALLTHREKNSIVSEEDTVSHLRNVVFQVIDDMTGQPLQNCEFNLCHFVYFKLKPGAPSPYLDKGAPWYITSFITDIDGIFRLDLADIYATDIVAIETREPHRHIRFSRSSDLAHTESNNHIRVIDLDVETSQVVSNTIYDLKHKVSTKFPIFGQSEEKSFEKIVLVARNPRQNQILDTRTQNGAPRLVSDQKPDVGSQEADGSGRNTGLRTQDTEFPAAARDGIKDAVLLPEYLESHTVLSLKTGQFIPQEQADDSKEPYLYYNYTFPPGASPSRYTVYTIPEKYIGVNAGNMNLGGFEWAPESNALQGLWSIEKKEALPDCPPRAKLTVNGHTTNGMFVSLPLTVPEREKQWPYITAFKGDDGTCGIFEITRVQDRKIHVRFKTLATESVQKPDVTSQETEGSGQHTANRTQDTEFIATLPNGLTVELVGLCEYPSDGKQWWRPDGTLMNRPYEKTTTAYLEPDYKLYELVCRLTGSDNILSDIDTNDTVMSSFGVFALPSKAEQIQLPDADLFSFACISCEPQATASDITFMIGLDSLWKFNTAMEKITKNTAMVNQVAGPHAKIGKPREGDGTTSVNISHNVRDQWYRIFARDKNLTVHPGIFYGSDTAPTRMPKNSGVMGISVGFHLPLSDIESIQFQTQQYQKITFKNVSLQPGVETEVEIEVERPEDTQRVPGASNFDFADIWRFVGSDLPKYTFALYRVIGHEYAPSFGSSPSDGCRRILFSETEIEDHFDASRPENYPLPGLILDKQPLFTEQDIVWYDWQSQQILLKPEALRRLPQIHKPPVNVFGVPFMVAVNGQRIYLGAFWTSVSSRSSGVPTIELGVFREARMQENVIEIWGGGIRKEMEQTTYPQRDWRIRDALASAGLLKEQYAEHASALRPDGETEVEVQSSVPGPSASERKKTLEVNLKSIFTACQMYNIENGKWPESIEDLQSSDGYGPYIRPNDTDDFSQLKFTRPYVNYRQITDPARTHFVYDISMLEEHKEIAVVYLDGHIEFLSPENEEFIGHLGNTFFPSEPPELNMNPVQSPNFELQRIN